MAANVKELVLRYKADPESVYNTWFIDNETRMKAFRSIRCGVKDVIDSIKSGSFPNDFKGSPLEFVLTCRTIGRKRSSPNSSGRRFGVCRAWRSGIFSFRIYPATARRW